MIPRAVVVVSLAILAACGRLQDRQTWPAELIVVDGATTLTHTARRNGAHELTYQLRQLHPAESVLTRIQAALAPDRWQPLTEDWLNPGNASAVLRNWSHFIDGTKTPNTVVHIWFGEWKDGVGNLVEYSLRYDSALPRGEIFLEKPDNDTLKVTALFFPAVVVTDTRRQAGITGPLK
jgi:hypothetical protein